MSSRVLQLFQARLRRLRVARHPGLLFCPGLEGFRDHTFGGRAGPSIEVINVLHEMAHAMEFGADQFEARCTPRGFVFGRSHRVEIGGRFYDQPTTCKSTERELQTFAYQLHLARLAGYRFTDSWFVKDCAHLMRLMPDWWNVPGTGDDQRKAYCAARIESHYQATTSTESVDRLECWLDKTAKRLNKKGKCNRPDHIVAPRFRVDGSCLA